MIRRPPRSPLDRSSAAADVYKRQVYLWSRPILLLLLIPLVIGLMHPLWHIEMQAPQYPKGLSLHVFAHTIVGGHDGADIKEINILNHYIGMQKLERAMFTAVSYTHLRAHETVLDLVCRLLLEKKQNNNKQPQTPRYTVK